MPTQHAPSENLHPTGSLTGRLVGGRRRVVYALEGDLDQASAAALADRLAALSGGTVGDIVLDLSGLEFLDSVGLEVLMRMHRRLRDDRRRLVLLDPAPPVSRLLELTLLDRSLIVESDGRAPRDGV